ncbi:MAG TPA: hypothetical protein VM452_16745 [Caulifigura sp.]|jgi:hypothetical protein|nr:hypothetical protein [Caulifigura sp.]
MADFSKYQQKVIKRYYDNRDQIDETKLAELVTSLYLASTDKQRDKLWTTARDLMERLEVPKTRLNHVWERRDPAILAEVVKDLQSGVLRKSKPQQSPPGDRGV